MAVLVITASTILLKINILWFSVITFSFSGFSIFYVLRKYNQTVNVFYDTYYLYLKYPHQTQKVKLQNIKRVQLALSYQRILGIQYYQYEIDFENKTGLYESVNIWINPIHDHISEFENCLDYYAPNVKIKHAVSSFDS